MKLKFPAIYSYAWLGSRGAWTGNALLPTGLLLKLPLNNNQTVLKARSNHKLYASTGTCLEGDRPNEERIQATGRHVAGLPPTTTVGGQPSLSSTDEHLWHPFATIRKKHGTEGLDVSRKDWIEYIVSEQDTGMNVEQIVRQKLNVSGRMMQRLTRSKGILLNRKQPFLQRQVKAGDTIAVRVIERQEQAPREPQRDTKPGGPITPMPSIEILYEDDHLLIANKPAGMMVHPIKQETDTLVHALAAVLAERGEQTSVHPVHRLDKDTSGAILVAKSSYGHQLADRLLREGGIHREYLAVASGVLSEGAGTIDAPIGRDARHPTKRRVVESGDHAITHYEVEQTSEGMTLARVWLETGRTHQIRVHFAHLGHPLAGDTMYGGARGLLRRQALHASKLSFLHPLLEKEIVVEAPIPSDMKRLMQAEFS